MKTMLITATAVGAAIAGLLLYTRRQNSASRVWADAAKDSLRTSSNEFAQLERDPRHTMG